MAIARIAIAAGLLPMVLAATAQIEAQETRAENGHEQYRDSIDLTLLSFVMGIYAVHYNYRIRHNGELFTLTTIVASALLTFTTAGALHRSGPALRRT